MKLLIDFLLLVLVWIIATIVVAGEFSLVRVRINKLMQEKQTTSVKYATHMVENINEYLSTLQVGITITSMLAGWIGEPVMTDLLMLIGVNKLIPLSILPIVSFLLLTYIQVVLTELLPKNLAMGAPVKTLLAVTKSVKFLHVLSYPLVWLLNKSTDVLGKWLKIPSVSLETETYSQEELINLMFSSSKDKNSDISQKDSKLVSKIVLFDDTPITEIMTALDQVVTESKVLENNFYTRIPTDDMKHYYHAGQKYPLPRLNSDVNLYDAINIMANNQKPIAVVEQNGEAIGIVTNNDIYEALFGTLPDEKHSLFLK